MSRYGVRQILDVVLKDIKSGEIVAILESLITSSIEFSGSTVYSRGGSGYARLIGFDSEKDATMNMEDALITKESLQVLTGSKFNKGAKIVHKKEVVEVTKDGLDLAIVLSKLPVTSAKYPILYYKTKDGYSLGEKLNATSTGSEVTLTGNADIAEGDKVIVDYYYEAATTTQSLTITTDIFPGTYKLEGTTTWRNEDGVDVEAVYTIPKLKINPGFTLPSMATGDPAPFTFTAEILKDTNSTAMVIIDLLEEE